MRLFWRSPTNSRPRESIAIACGVSNSPAPDPFLPQVLMNFPSLSNFTIRALVSRPCPSATKMSPLAAVTTAEGALNSSGPLPGVLALPSVNRTLPSGPNLNTWWPLPPRPRPSLTQTLPARSTCMPCGNNSRPAPKLFNRFPDESNLRMGSSFDPSQANGKAGLMREGGMDSPHRSATQTLVPSGSMATALVDPQLRPSGSLPQLAIVRYGLGAELVGAVPCASATLPAITMVAAAANASMNADGLRTSLLPSANGSAGPDGRRA